MVCGLKINSSIERREWCGKGHELGGCDLRPHMKVQAVLRGFHAFPVRVGIGVERVSAVAQPHVLVISDCVWLMALP